MSIKAASSFSLKDQLFNASSLAKLSARLAAARPKFPRSRFERTVLERFPELELKERIDWIVTVLEKHLPARFPDALDILHRTLPEPLDPTRTDDDFGEFIWVVPGAYAARHGCSVAHLERSLAFLKEATKRFSAEAAIRPFLRAFPAKTLAFMRACAHDPNYHVRRLASEGVRPFLPWAPRVDLPLDEVVRVLDSLHADPTRYVTRSVANGLNDISKIDADLSLATLRRWHQLDRQRPEELAWMTRHGTRTLVKAGNIAALELLGYATRPRFRISGVEHSTTVKVGEAFEWRCTLHSLARQRLRLALHVHFLKAGGRHVPKVFSVADLTLAKGAQVEISKRLPLRPATTRTLYLGQHHATLVVNGVVGEKVAFELVQAKALV